MAFYLRSLLVLYLSFWRIRAAHTSLAPPATIYSGGHPITTTTATHVFPDPGDNVFLRPSAGEILTAGSTYTVSWSSPAGSLVNINLNGGAASEFGELCKGWIINSKCGSLALDLPNSGSFVWKLATPDDSLDFGPNGIRYWLSMWQNGKSDLDAYALPAFQSSANFTIVRSGNVAPHTTPVNTPSPSSTSKSLQSTLTPSSTTFPFPSSSLQPPSTPSFSKTFSSQPSSQSKTAVSTATSATSSTELSSSISNTFTKETTSANPGTSRTFSTSSPDISRSSATTSSNITPSTRSPQQTQASASTSPPTATSNSVARIRFSPLNSWFLVGTMFLTTLF